MKFSDAQEPYGNYAHAHGKWKHAHAHGHILHAHLLRAICHRIECEGYPTHDIHPGVDS